MGTAGPEGHVREGFGNSKGWGQRGHSAPVATQAMAHLLCPSHFIADIQKLKTAKLLLGVGVRQGGGGVQEAP